MARRVITIEEKISRKEEEVFKLKKRYEEALEELNTLVKQKKEAKDQGSCTGIPGKWKDRRRSNCLDEKHKIEKQPLGKQTQRL